MVLEQTKRRGHLTDLERAAVRMAVGALEDREQRVVREHFWHRHTVTEIAYRLKTTARRVREILREALRQVRYTLELLFGFCFE